jgi:subtilisin family serine protease
MKYLVFRKRPAGDDPFLELFGGESGHPPPPTAAPEELEDHHIEDLRRDPDVVDIITSIPLSLIEPVQASAHASSAGEAWGIEAVGGATSPETGAGVTVAVLDTGIDTNHAAFKGLVFGPDNLIDFTAGSRPVPGQASDQHGHGTHVAGTLFGRNVQKSRIGVAPGVQRALIAKVLGPGGAPSEAVYRAIVWALDQKADVISMSLGFNYTKVVEYFVAQEKYPSGIAAGRALEAFRSTARLFDRISALIDAFVKIGQGAVVVAATGNESLRGEDPRFTVPAAPPAVADGFIPVGALTRTGDETSRYAVARFSNTGCLLAAPGERILSAQAGISGGLVEKSGTSMATPHVAGVAALWIERLFPSGHRPPSWARDVERAMASHAIPISGQARIDVGLGLARAPQ